MARWIWWTPSHEARKINNPAVVYHEAWDSVVFDSANTLYNQPKCQGDRRPSGKRSSSLSFLEEREAQETESAKTFAEGLATRVAFTMTFNIIFRLIYDIVLVSEQELKKAIVMLSKRLIRSRKVQPQQRRIQATGINPRQESSIAIDGWELDA